MRALVLASGLILSCTVPGAAAPAAAAEEVRAIWVTRFEYRTEADVRSILSNCAGLGFNTVLFQVRGQADAYYRSSIEPWAERLGGKDPGFDALDAACREAKRLGLSLHAWINTMPAWRGKTPPEDRTHVALRRPDWIVVGKDGRRQAFNDHYLCLNPCLPEVRDHIVSVVRDLARRYPIDGLHLDYVRFIEGDWSYDAKTIALFGGPPAGRPAEWTAFRRAAVTETVRRIRQAFKEERPAGILSAAAYPTAEARGRIHQDAEGWVRRGLVDWVFPMTYQESDAGFRDAIDEGYALFADGRVCFPGIGAYLHRTAEQTVRQIRMCRGGGFALFSYSSLFVSPEETRRENAALCKARRDAVRKLLSR